MTKLTIKGITVAMPIFLITSARTQTAFIIFPMNSQLNWPDLVLPPLNLWNFPIQVKKRCRFPDGCKGDCLNCLPENICQFAVDDQESYDASQRNKN